VETRTDQIERFAARLLETPGLRQLPGLQKEEQALQFLKTNGARIQPVFASLGLDVTRGWKEPAAIIARAVRLVVDKLLDKELAAIVGSRCTLSFFPGVAGGRQPPSRWREELLALVKRIAAHPVARGMLSGALAAVESDLTDRYIPEAWERKKYVYGEITRVQRLNLPSAELAELVRFILLVRSAPYLHVTPGSTAPNENGPGTLQEPFLQKILPHVCSLVPSLPGSLVQMAMRSTLAFPAQIEATARIAAVLALRGRTLVPGLIVDRGADTPDKSWLNVARRNARWHGLDSRLLDELYTISAENGW